MYKLVLSILLFLAFNQAIAEPSEDLVEALKPSVVKVHVYTKSGGRGVGTGVVVGSNLVATNCHVLANSNGITVLKMGESYGPVAIKVDWKHDLCLLKFTDLPLSPIALGESENLKYEQEIFSVGFSGNSPKPLTTWGKIKALYPLDDSQIIRTSASFRLGASGSPVFDGTGKLIAINTFKSPGRQSYFYNIPVKWVKQLLGAPETKTVQQEVLPFWDAPEELRPFFMRVVLPLQNEQWAELERIATQWATHEPANAEAWYYLGLAQDKQSHSLEAHMHFQQALKLNPQHPSALYELGLLASQQGDQNEVQKIHTALNQIDQELAEALQQAIEKQKPGSAATGL